MRFGWRRSCIASRAWRWRPSCRCISSRSGWPSRAKRKLESFLRWSDRPLVKLAEGVLVFLLAVHLLGGVRLLVLENLSWLDGQKRLALLAVAASAVIAFAFLARVF